MPYDGLTSEEREYFTNLNKTIAVAGELRQLRIFISHRWDQHTDLYRQITGLLQQHFGAFQNLSIPEGKRLVGEQGGDREKHELKAQMAARIFVSDVVIMPTNVGMVRKKDSTLFEIQLATLAYSIPTVFIKKPKQKRNIGIVGQASVLGLAHYVANNTAKDIAEGVQKLVMKKTLLSRFHSDGGTTVTASRHPSTKVIDEIMREFPYLRQNQSILAFQTTGEKEAELRRSLRRRNR